MHIGGRGKYHKPIVLKLRCTAAEYISSATASNAKKAQKAQKAQK
jgi:hypothetical protein